MRVKDYSGERTFDRLLSDAEAAASTNKEMDFVQDVSDRYGEYGGNTVVSDAQIEWLERIAK